MEFNMLHERRATNWALVTYADESLIRCLCLGAEHYAYILHDKDQKEPHYHVLLHYRSQKKFKTILRELQSEQNTLGEPIKNLYGMVRYLTHEGQDEKHIYEEELIHSDDFLWWKKFAQEPDEKSPLSVINDIISGVSLRTLISRYGSTIVFQWKNWSNMAYMISRQDKGFHIDYERFSEQADNDWERARLARAYEKGDLLFDPDSEKIFSGIFQKMLDK